MTLEHVAIWANKLEKIKDYYSKYFDGKTNDKYVNKENGFESYFISFDSGARLEIMKMANIPENKNDTVKRQHIGIIHLAFGVDSRLKVDQKAVELKSDGFPILSGPRQTGDGYYEFETIDPEGNRIEVTTNSKI